MKKFSPEGSGKKYLLSALLAGLASGLAFTPAFSVPPQPAPSAPAPPVKSAGGEIDGFTIYQTSTITGDKDVLVSANAVKVVDRKNGNGIIARAPDWKVYVLNPRSRRICSYTLAKYPGSNKEIVGITGGAPLHNLPLKRGAKSTVSGTAAVSCETSKTFESKQLKDLERAFAGPRFAKWAQLMIADTGPMDKLPKNGKIALCRYYGVAEFNGDGLPLQFKYVDLTDQLHTLLLTNSVMPIKLPANTFDPPRDYTTVADMGKLDDRPKYKDNGPMKAIEVMKKRNLH